MMSSVSSGLGSKVQTRGLWVPPGRAAACFLTPGAATWREPHTGNVMEAWPTCQPA